MKRLAYFFILISQIALAQTPLPPLGTHPVWEISVTTISGTQISTLSYGDLYERCGHIYVAILENDHHEILYLRQTENKVYYLLELDDCNAERLLYDYSVEDNLIIPIQTELNYPDSFQLVNVSVTGELTDQILGNEVKQVNYSYQSGPFTLQTPSFWIRGVGDIIHPFYPIYNNFDLGIERTVRLRSLKVNHMTWFCSDGNYCSSNQIIYVDKDVTAGNQDGTSWNNAFYSLQEALNSADFGDVLWVAEGRYTLPPDSERFESFVLRDGISIYGGFAGDEVFFGERNTDLFPVFISGDIGVPNVQTDNTFHVIRVQDITNYAVLDGIWIMEGNALGGDISFPFLEDGGGLLFYSAIPTTDTIDIILNDCQISNNHAQNGGGLSFDDTYHVPTRFCLSYSNVESNSAINFGGGMFIPPLDVPIFCQFDSVAFRQNQINSGGGGAIYDLSDLANWVISRSSFSENHMIYGEGGAIGILHVSNDKNLRFLRTNFAQNRCSTDGGAVSFIHDGMEAQLNARFDHCRFLENTGHYGAGGGISIASFSQFVLHLEVNGCEFQGNQSANRGSGVHILSDGQGGNGKISINHSIFSGNRAIANIGGGIKIEIGTPNDQIITNKRYEVDVQNSVFIRNKGAYSQGTKTDETSCVSTFSNCTFYDNGLITLSKNYSESLNDSTSTNELHLQNCILWEDLPLWQILYNGNPNSLNVYKYSMDHCLISVDDCTIPGGEETCNSNLNYFNTYPLFRDSTNNDLSLLACSPFINSGVLYPDISAKDIAGNVRIQEGIVDIGAYESGSYAAAIDSLTEELNCFADSTGQISIHTINGTNPISYFLLDSDSILVSSDNSGSFQGLVAGEYLLISQDALGCKDTVSFGITEPDPIMIWTRHFDFISEDEQGEIIIDSIVGGIPPYEILFENGLITGSSIQDLGPGGYLLVVQDSAGCRVDTILEILLVNKVLTNDLQNDLFRLAPNPAYSSSFVQVEIAPEFFQEAPFSVEIYGEDGRLLEKGNIPILHRPWIFLSPHQSGKYYIVFRSSTKDRHILAVKQLIVL